MGEVAAAAAAAAVVVVVVLVPRKRHLNFQKWSDVRVPCTF